MGDTVAVGKRGTASAGVGEGIRMRAGGMVGETWTDALVGVAIWGDVAITVSGNGHCH